MLSAKKIAVVFCLPLILFSCKENKNELDKMIAKQEVFPSEEGQVVEILYTDSGIVTMRLTAPVLNHFTSNVPEPYTEMPKGIIIEFFNKEGEVKTTMRALYAIRFEKSKRLEARNKVVVVNVNGEILNTEKLNWDEASKKIYTDVFVKITTKKDVMRGTGMEANQDFTEYEIRNFSGSSSLPGEDKPEKEEKEK
ncbi:MAG: LPS export ABC transporter periplasmic protein LptC [Bacteroidia bacterium]